MEAAKAAEREITNTEYRFEHRGVSFVLPADARMLPVEAIEAFEDDKVVTFVREMVAPDKFQEWKASFAPNRATMADIDELAREVGKAYGFNSAGESSASRSSSSETSKTSRHSFSETTDSDSEQLAGDQRQ